MKKAGRCKEAEKQEVMKSTLAMMEAAAIDRHLHIAPPLNASLPSNTENLNGNAAKIRMQTSRSRRLLTDRVSSYTLDKKNGK